MKITHVQPEYAFSYNLKAPTPFAIGYITIILHFWEIAIGPSINFQNMFNILINLS